MLAAERQSMIYALVREKGSAKIGDLAKALRVSGMTVRRDLEFLEAERVLHRVHGGAVSVAGPAPDLPFASRSVLEVNKKLEIAESAKKLVKEGMNIAIDGSTTGLEFARRLRGLEGITAVTNNVGVLWEFHDRSDVHVMMLGGALAGDGNTVEGTFAVDQASQMYVDMFFFSCAGFDELSITNSTHIGGDVKKGLLENAKQNVLLADSSKFGRRGFLKLFECADVDTLITDDEIEEEAVANLLERAPHLKIEVADSIGRLLSSADDDD